MNKWMPLLTLTMLLFAGCNNQPASDADGAAAAGDLPKYFVVFSQCNNAEPYRAAQNKRIEELFAQSPEVKLVIFDGQADAAKQISQVENAMLQKPDLLIVAPLERNALSDVMGRAMEAEIPTICLERDIVEPNFTCFISADNVAIGRLAGQFIVDHLTEKHGEAKGALVELTGMKGVQGGTDRHNGAFEVLEKHPNIKVVHQATGNWFQAEATSRMEEALSANAEIDVVYAHNDPMAYGAYLAAEEANRAADIAFVGVDGLPNEGVQYVNEGILAASFEYPLCVDKAYEVGMQLLTDSSFTPEKTYILESRAITPSK